MKTIGKILAVLIGAYAVYFVAVFGFYVIRDQLRGDPVITAAELAKYQNRHPTSSP